MFSECGDECRECDELRVLPEYYLEPVSIPCPSCKGGIAHIAMYEHRNGWRIVNFDELQWVYYKCPSCRQETSWERAFPEKKRNE